MLVPGGLLAVMDSPMFTTDEDGRAMVADRIGDMAARYRLPTVLWPGVGYLTFAALHRAATTLHARERFFASRGSWSWRAHRALARLRLGRRPAAFGVWVAQER